jgi:tRNA(Ile)-lysidine synthase
MRLRRLAPVLRRALAGPCAVPPGARLLVAVSGGADSVALLLGLHALAPELGITLHAAHLNHGLRGAEADADQAFVEALCARLGVPLVAARWDCRGRMKRRRLAGQSGLRTLRREFLASAARRAGAGVVATAHTADDQLETLLLRLARGTGLRGLAGMRPRRGPWIKPLLEATRHDIESDLAAHRQTWREDASNRDLRYARSRVRHEVIPALARVGSVPGAPGPVTGGRERARASAPARQPTQAARDHSGLARRTVAALAELRDAHRVVTLKAARILERVARIHRDEIALDSRALRSYPFAIQRTVLRLLWQCPGHAGHDLTQRHLDALLSLIATARGGSRVDLPDGWRAVRDRGHLYLRRGADAAPAAAPRPVPAEGSWARGAVRGRWLSGASARDRLGCRAEGDEFFAGEEIVGGLQLRPATPDEWFMPFGGRAPRRLGDFLSKQPVSRASRAHPIVLADAQGILWVVGVRRSDRAPITPSTRRALWVHAETP